MEIIIKLVNDTEVAKVIAQAKELKAKVIWERDGEYGTQDLRVLAKFQKEGFNISVSTHKGKHSDEAITVEFWLAEDKP